MSLLTDLSIVERRVDAIAGVAPMRVQAASFARALEPQSVARA